MRRSTLLTLAVLAVQFPISIHSQSLTEEGTQPFAIDFPQEVKTGRIQIEYAMTGSFGAYGDHVYDVFKKSGEHRILVPTQVEGTPASSLKAILYVPGCQIETIEVPDLAKSTLQASFQCRSLPTLAFTGRIAPPGMITDPQTVVDITYVALWPLRFLEIPKGPSYISYMGFRIATVPLEAGVVFHAELPDFSKDSATKADGITGISFTARNKRTGNYLGRLFRPNIHSLAGSIPIQPEYPSEVLFTFHKIKN
jgi:hypothetical protein